MRPLSSCRLSLFLPLCIFLVPSTGADEAPRRPFILLTNDDGADAPGLAALREELVKIADVLVVAPLEDSSGSSQALSFGDTITVKALPDDGRGPRYAAAATPATCVLLAHEHLSGGRPFDFVASGINKGENVGLDIACSGTVGAARMAADLGMRAAAFSLAYGSKEQRAAAEMSAKLVLEAMKERLEPGIVINVNFPRGESSAWKKPALARPGGRGFTVLHESVAPAGPDLSFKPRLGLAKGPFPEGSDARLLSEGFVTVTPLAATGADAAFWKSVAGWGLFR